MEDQGPRKPPNAIVLSHESAEAFDLLQERYYQRFQPANQPEADLVDQLIAATWRLRRINAVESAAIEHTMDIQRPRLDATYQDLKQETRAHLAYEKLHLVPGAMAAYQRSQSAQIRQYDRALKNLRLLQSERKQETAEIKKTRNELT